MIVFFHELVVSVNEAAAVERIRKELDDPQAHRKSVLSCVLPS